MSNFIKKSQTNRIDEHSVSTFSEYGISFSSLAVGVSEINGRYPVEGFDVDTEIEQVWYVESGEGTVCVEDQEYYMEVGDMLLIKASQKYWIDGQNLKLVVSSTPPWVADQHKHVS